MRILELSNVQQMSEAIWYTVRNDDDIFSVDMRAH